MLPTTNLTAISSTIEPLVSIPPGGKRVEEIFINATLPKGLYLIAYKAYLYIPQGNNTMVTEKIINATLIVKRCTMKK
jgi:hypothetical protein